MDVLRTVRREKKPNSDVVVVIYLNGADKSGAQTAAVAKIVDEIQRHIGDESPPDDVLTLADLRMDRNRRGLANPSTCRLWSGRCSNIFCCIGTACRRNTCSWNRCSAARKKAAVSTRSGSTCTGCARKSTSVRR